jgi:endonuclease III related protein
MGTREKLMEMYGRMMEAYGPQKWWPGETPFEVMVGAVLTQNTNWTNVEKAIGNLKRQGLLSPEAIHNMESEELAEVIRPAGYYRVKAGRLKNLMRWMFERFEGDVERMLATPMRELREGLLSVSGIGKETADSVLLYAGGKLSFVVDTYTYRVMRRHGMIEPEADYERVREMFMESLDEDAGLYNEYHALLVKVGKEHCKPRARCEGCPLEELEHEVSEEME